MSALNWTHLTPDGAFHVVGLDLGRQQDPSALALLRYRPQQIPGVHTIGYPRVYEVPTLKRWPLQTPYRTVAENVAAFLRAPPLNNTPTLVVADETGVGAAVCEMIREQLALAGVRGTMACVTITGGSAAFLKEGQPGAHSVAKKQLVSILQVLLGNGRLHIAEQPEAKTLERELRTFTVKITSNANETFEAWRERDHDDLVLAVALAAWGAEKLCLPRRASDAGPDILTA